MQSLKKEDKLSVVVLAAGNSSRMNKDYSDNNKFINKQFIEICGTPILIHTLRSFEKLDYVEEILIVTRKSEIDRVKKLVSDYGISKIRDVIEGGDIRRDSAFNALNYGLKCGYTAIQDGARLFSNKKIIDDTFDAAKKYGAAAPAVEVKDTLKQVDEKGFVVSTPDRSVFRQIQTPQIFKTELILKAHKKAREDGYIGTDDCSFAEYAGEPVMLVKGDYNNIKVTTKEDINIAEAIYKQKN